MENVEWQFLFNAAFGMFLAALGWFFRSINQQLKRTDEEMGKLGQRQDALDQKLAESAKDIRREESECQRRLPQIFVPRHEYQQAINMIQQSLQRIESKLDGKKDKGDE